MTSNQIGKSETNLIPTSTQLDLITSQMIQTRKQHNCFCGAWGSLDPKNNIIDTRNQNACYSDIPNYFHANYKQHILYTVFNGNAQNEATPKTLAWLECLLSPRSPFHFLWTDHLHIQNLSQINQSGFIWKDVSKINLPVWWCFHIASRMLQEHQKFALSFSWLIPQIDKLPSLHWAILLSHTVLSNNKLCFPYGPGHTIITGDIKPYMKRFLINQPKFSETFADKGESSRSTYGSQGVFLDENYSEPKQPKQWGHSSPKKYYELPELIDEIQQLIQQGPVS